MAARGKGRGREGLAHTGPGMSAATGAKRLLLNGHNSRMAMVYKG